MPLLEYEQHNERVAFPFRDLGTTVPIEPQWITDCHLVLNADVTWNYDTPVYLSAVIGESPTEAITFRLTTNVTLPDATTTDIDFNFRFTSSEAVAAVECATDAAYGFGVMTSGDLSTTNWTTVAVSPAEIELEPVCIQTNQYVFAVRIANKWSTLYETDTAGCEYTPPDISTTNYDEIATVFQGDVKIKEGRFCQVSVIESSGSIIVQPEIDEEQGGELPCGDIRPLPVGYTDSEEARCEDMLFTFNGVPVPDGSNLFRFEGSNGISITTPSGTPNTINITFEAQSLLGLSDDECPDGIGSGSGGGGGREVDGDGEWYWFL